MKREFALKAQAIVGTLVITAALVPLCASSPIGEGAAIRRAQDGAANPPKSKSGRMGKVKTKKRAMPARGRSASSKLSGKTRPLPKADRTPIVISPASSKQSGNANASSTKGGATTTEGNPPSSTSAIDKSSAEPNKPTSDGVVPTNVTKPDNLTPNAVQPTDAKTAAEEPNKPTSGGVIPTDATTKRGDLTSREVQPTDAAEGKNKPTLRTTPPTDAAGYYEVGMSHYESKRFKDAVEAFKQSIRLGSTDPKTYFNLGQAYYSLNLYKEARESYKRAVKVKPDWDEAHYRLGWIYHLLGDKTQALAQYKILQTLNPEMAANFQKLIDYANTDSNTQDIGAAAKVALPCDGQNIITDAHVSKENGSNLPGGNTSSTVKKLNFSRLRCSELSTGTVITIESDGAHNRYSSYRQSDRYYVVIPDSAAPSIKSGVQACGFDEMQVRKNYNDTILSFHLRPGAKASPRQSFNQLEIVFDLPCSKTVPE